MFCRKCNIEGPDDAKICRSCGSILDTGREEPPMSWLDPPTEQDGAAAEHSQVSLAPIPPDEGGMRSDWLCVNCGSLVKGDEDVCWNCVAKVINQPSDAAEQPSELQEFLTQIEASPPPAEPAMELVNEPLTPEPEPSDGEWREMRLREVASYQTKCRRCGSERLMTDVTIQDQSNSGFSPLKVIVFKEPDAILFRGALRSEIMADICGDCGQMELRIAQPQELYRHWRSSL